MRELYNAPELKLISFVPHENISVFSFDFEEVQDGKYNPVQDEEEKASLSVEVS